jgi:hypothetical protein
VVARGSDDVHDPKGGEATHVKIRPLGGTVGCLSMILFSILASVLLTVLLNLLLR